MVRISVSIPVILVIYGCQHDCFHADAILEYFLEAATKEFIIGRIDQSEWHPDYCSPRVVIYISVKK